MVTEHYVICEPKILVGEGDIYSPIKLSIECRSIFNIAHKCINVKGAVILPNVALLYIDRYCNAQDILMVIDTNKYLFVVIVKFNHYLGAELGEKYIYVSTKLVLCLVYCFIILTELM